VKQKLADASADRNERPYTKQQHSHIDYDATVSVADKTVTDPVCGVTVNPATTPHRHLDKTYVRRIVDVRARDSRTPPCDYWQ
jgi:hypothetical protein